MKTKKKTSVSAYQRATMLMDRETNRAVAHVQMLKRLYAEAQKKAKASS
jgi:hypothetical protein